LVRIGRGNDAIGYFEKAIDIDPQFADAHGNLGAALATLGRVEEAIDHYNKALLIQPDWAQMHNNLAIALARCKKIDEAIPHWEQAVKLNPKLAEAHQNMGMILYLQGQVPQAVARWRQGIKECPDHLMMLCLTARALATNGDAAVRNGPEAVELAEQAARIFGGQNATVLDVLAAAYAEAGRFPEAVETAQKALAAAANNAALTTALQAKLKLYQSGSAFHEDRQAAPSPLNLH
jgi:protein O-mannosyl-transferase